MATFAPFSGILVPGESDPPSVDGNAFFTTNPGIIDQFLKIGVVTHRHDAHLPIANPSTILSGSVVFTGGALPPSTTFYSTFTLVDQYGGETLPASATALTTSAGVGSPTGFVTASADYASGILRAGDYYYAKTFVDGAGGETPIGPSTLIYVDPGFASAQVHIGNLMADAPPGATGARLWRSYEGEDWHLVVQTASDTYLDAGFDPPDNPAIPPTTDGTNQTNELHLTIPSDPAMTSACAFINLYFSSDPAFGSPSFYAQYPTASAGATVTVTSETTTAGEPPHVSRASRGAAQINPDTDILNYPWKRPVSTFSALPSVGNSNGDTRIVLNELGLYTWSASAHAWNHTGDGDTGGSGGSGGSGGASASLILTDGTTSVVVSGSIFVEGSGAASATVVDDGAGNATLIITVPVDSDATDTDTGGGGSGSAFVISDGVHTTTMTGTLTVSGSGGASATITPTGSGNANLIITIPTDTDTDTDSGGGGSASAGVRVDGLGAFSDIEFVGSGGALVAVSDIGGGSARVTISASGVADYELIVPNVEAAAYYIVAADMSNVVELDKLASAFVTISSQDSLAVPIGSWVEVYQEGAGQAVIVGDPGVAIEAPAGGERAAAGSATLAWPGGSPLSNHLSIAHGLPGIPFVTALPQLGDTASASAVSMFQYQEPDATNMYFRGTADDLANPSASISTPFHWIATLSSAGARYGTAERYATIRARKRTATRWALSGELGLAAPGVGGSGPGSRTPTLVNASLVANGATSSPCTLTVPTGGVPVGSFLSVACWSTWNGLAGSITDSRGNTYTMNSLSGNNIVVFSCPVTTALIAGDTITYSFGGNFANMNVAVFSAVGTLRNLGTVGSGSSPVTSIVGDLVIGYGDLEGGGSGVSHRDSTAPWANLFTNNSYTGGAAQAVLSGDYLVTPASGTITWHADSLTGQSIALAYRAG